MPQQPAIIPAISKALLVTFQFDELETLVAETVNEDVRPLKPMTDGHVRQYFRNVTSYLDERDLLSEVVVAARKERPRSVELMEAAEKLAVSAAGRVLVDGQSHSLEAAVRHVVQRVDVLQLRTSIGLAEQQVGSVQTNGKGFGTAFLIAPDRVMTNWHVAEVIDDGTVSPLAVEILFDFKKDAIGATLPGVGVKLAADWLIHHRPYVPFDTEPPPQADPAPTDLDYAIIRLERKFGEEDMAIPIFANHTRRGWFDLARHRPPPAAHEPIYLLGHPEGDPLTASMGSVVEHAGQGRRVRHDAYSEGGSSGSPLFNGNGELIGLHHGTDPKTGDRARYNQAIPMSLVVQDYVAAGV
jgi:S1-C subfamily serine protease